jgi:hypothetical protein
MMKMPARRAVQLIMWVTVALLGCGGPSGPPASLYTLPSGKQIKITGRGRMHFTKGPDALVMNYETDIPIDDKVALRKEVDEIWTLFKIDVERAGLTNAAIRVTHPEGSGLITHAKGYGFVFEKRADGNWHCLEDDKHKSEATGSAK